MEISTLNLKTINQQLKTAQAKAKAV